MKRQEIFSMVLASCLGSTLAFSATVVPAPEMICTRDLNPWLQSSRCSCPEETRYDQRIGYCVKGPAENLAIRGEIETNVLAIGGETTGIVLTSLNDARYELIMPAAWEEKAKAWETQGRTFEVRGEFIDLPAVELPARPALIVSSIQELSPAASQKQLQAL